MPVAFYMDEHVSDAITQGLRDRGVDVLRVQDDGHRSTDDLLIVLRATELNRVVFTQDEDFLKIAAEHQQSGVEFSGVIYAHQKRVPIGLCLEHLEIAAGASAAEDFRNKLTYLPLRTPGGTICEPPSL